MAYRYTNTEKWGDAWFTSLKPLDMLLFLYLVDNCDIAGFIEVNYKRWATDLNSTTEKIQGACKGLARGLKISNDESCFYVRNFLKHQKNLPLNENNKAHLGILKRFELYSQKFEIEDINEFITSPLEGAKKGLPSPTGNGNGNGNGIGNGIGKIEKEGNFENSKTQFSEMLKDFEADYKSEMLLDFFEYWTEPNKPKTKCRYELEKTWDTARRLATWAKNQKQFSSSETISEATHALKPIWDEFYYQKTGLKYYFDSISMKILNQIENQLQFTIKEGGSGSTTPIAFKFMLDNIKDKWVLDNLSLKIIASKYNEIISKIKKPSQNGKPSLEDNLAELNAIINEMYPE